MKILLSAYACEPNKGSEPERNKTNLLIWSRGIRYTRSNNKNNIEQEIKKKFKKFKFYLF